MTTPLAIENEQLRLEASRLKAKLKAALEATRKLQQSISDANCKAMALINALMGTKR